MWIIGPLARRVIVWCFAYFWTASAALAISYAVGWQYDGDLGWWLVAGYSFPALLLASPIQSMIKSAEVAAVVDLSVLAVLTVTAMIAIRHSAKLSKGS